ncbi:MULTISPECIES: hemolysin family protein [Cytobacillus]|jgi:CBS domain containing-hemolysin-like protein|uniref:CBS domain containing-hemolysin-like protein n=2 Tax=Cytobacillus TaxID=2675230 RepID=A0ABX3CS47_9BACI|nr:hemolysin family protein [Cytobacillus oceanisediminis]EFV78739.1 YhdP protein [Bacillus sp. 2_A_57_CT2]MBY0159924.1 HlyC/CorC family transporter [Cytobacillus firmus]MCM3241201.1 hemolysin family protein [Cytobacillus oceanisediminis]MCM3392201.1 hemolysin family protein [Cytobacillus oceanisediminis]MCM3528610.1 hemolysin family protein [Cytobacillus oceanisediminis]
MITLNLFLLFLLIALTAFFVASEFAIVKVRTSRIDQLIMEGNAKARSAKQVISSLDEYLSACQLGITITALGLGWLGEPTIERLLHPLFESINLQASITHILSFVIAFSVVTFLHVVIGELAPKTFAIQKAEAITLSFSKPLIVFYRIMYPFIWILNGSARIITGLFGLKPVSESEMAHSEEELRIILSESLKSGEINPSEYQYVDRIFEFDNRIAKEIMVPRTEIVTLPEDSSLAETLDLILNERYTRYPVTAGDKDNILGIINVKEILTDCVRKKCEGKHPLRQYIKPVIRVIETIPIHDLLLRMQKERFHMAILLDEYGGTAGVVTVEDILEEIVGEIRDEFDADELPFVQKPGENHYILDAKLLISEANDLLGTSLSDDDVDTIGGWIMTQKYDAAQGDFIEEEGFRFIIKEMEGHHISYIEVVKI